MTSQGPLGIPGSLGAALEFVEARFRGRFDYREFVVTVGTSLVLWVPPDYERISLTLVNFGPADVIIAPNQLVGVNRGLRLAAGGGMIAVDVTEDGLLPCLEWDAISSGAGNNVYALGVYRYKTVDTNEPRV